MNQEAQLVQDMPFTLEDGEVELPSATTTLVTIDSDTGDVEVEDDMPEDTEENRSILERVERRKKNIADEWWQLAADLFEVKLKKLHRLAGYQQLEQYFDHTINSTPRYGFELISIHQFFSIDLAENLSHKPEAYYETIQKVKLLGVTKTKEIAKGRIEDPEVVVDIVNQISKPNEQGYMPTVADLKTMIVNYREGLKQQPGTVEAEKERKRKERQEQNKKEVFKFKLPLGQAMKVKEVLAGIIEKQNIDADDPIANSLAFYRICEEWAIENQASRDGTRPGLDSELKRFEEIYSVKLIAFPATAEGELSVDSEKGLSISYGSETFAKIVDDDNGPST